MKLIGFSGIALALSAGALVACNGGGLTPTQKAVGDVVLCGAGADFIARSLTPDDPLVQEGAKLACALFGAIPVKSGTVTGDAPLTAQQQFCSSFQSLPGAGPVVVAYNAEYARQCNG